MPFDLDNLNPAKKFYWGDEEKEWVNIRLATEGDIQKFRIKAGIKQSAEYKMDDKGKPQRVEYVDTSDDKIIKFNDLMNDHYIDSWNIFDTAGNVIPCTTENKLKLINGSKTFSNWLSECLKKLNDDEENKREEEVKN